VVAGTVIVTVEVVSAASAAAFSLAMASRVSWDAQK
jgi:hypothetical protein